MFFKSKMYQMFAKGKFYLDSIKVSKMMEEAFYQSI
jgi:hypothetical protein